MALDFVAGCVGGMAGVVVGYPLDTVKVQMQTNNSYRGAYHCCSTILKNDGVSGLFRGMASPILGVSAINALVFGVYGFTHRLIENSTNLRSHFYAGAVAGLVQSPVCSVTELVKIQLQILSNTSAGKVNTMDIFMEIYKTHGIRNGLLRGLPITVVRECPAFGLYFFTYEFMTNSSSSSTPVSTLQMLVAGGISGQVSWLFTYPVDVIKTRLQSDLARKRYSGVFNCIATSYRDEGVRCFYQGITPTLIRAFPTNAVCFAVVNWVFHLYNKVQNPVSDKIHTDTLWVSRVDNICDNVL